MLPKSQRLTRADFAAIPSRATVVHGDLFSLKVAPALRHGVSKCAVVISSKAIKRSVDRHRVKRRAMEAIQKLKLPEAGLSRVFYTKSSAQKASYQAITDEIMVLLRKSSN